MAAQNSLFPQLGVIGVGWVGSQHKRYFEEILGYRVGTNLHLDDIDPTRRAGDIEKADVIFITVPTPRNPKDGSCDTTIVEAAVSRIRGQKIVVVKSTVPPGTTERLQRTYPKHKFLFNPEFLTESRAWEDMLRPDRQIVGFTAQSMDAAQLVLSLLPKAPFMSPWGMNTYHPIRITATEAELIKYAGNVYFAHKVNWANALAKAAEKVHADYENVRMGMAADYRIGDSHLDVFHGGYRGFGGYCLPKDLDGFMHFARAHGLEDVYTLLKANRDFNEALLAEQGLTLEDVSAHSTEVQKKLDARKRRVRSRR